MFISPLALIFSYYYSREILSNKDSISEYIVKIKHFNHSQYNKDIMSLINEKIDVKIIIIDKNDFLKCKLNATSNIPYFIAPYHSWLAHLIVQPYILTKDSYKITIGHELAHKLFDKSTYNVLIKTYPQYKKLLSIINEIHHDYWGAKIFEYNRVILKNACIYKHYFNTKAIKAKYKEDGIHPLWSKRIKYARYGVFDTKLLNQITRDIGFCIYNPEIKELLDQVIQFYGTITLIDNIKNEPQS